MLTLKKYMAIAYLQILAQLQYPVDALIGLVNQLLILGIEVVGVFVLFQRFGIIEDWTLEQVLLIYGITNLAFAFSETVMRGFETNLSSLIIQGELDRYLLRPMSVVLQISAFNLQYQRFGRVLMSLVVLVYALNNTQIIFTVPNLILMLLSILSGILVFMGIYLFAGLICFVLLKRPEILGVLVQGSVLTMQYPKVIFPKWIQNLFTYIVPVTIFTYFPIAYLLQKPINLTYGFCILLQFYGILFFVIMLSLFIYMMKKYYQSSGS